MSTDTERTPIDECHAGDCKTPVDEQGAIIYGREGRYCSTSCQLAAEVDE